MMEAFQLELYGLGGWVLGVVVVSFLAIYLFEGFFFFFLNECDMLVQSVFTLDITMLI